MKVLMIDSLIGNDYTIWLCRGLAKATHEVNLVTVKNHPLKTDETFRLYAISPSKEKDKSTVVKSLEYLYFLVWITVFIIFKRPDIVHFQFFRRNRMESLYFPFLSLISKQIIFTAHNILPHENSKLDYYLRWLVYKTASRLIVHTDKIKHELANRFRLNLEKVTVVPAVKPISGSYDEAVTKETARDTLGIAESTKVLLFFGFIREYKGLDILLDAFDEACEDIDNLLLLVAGKPYTQKLFEQYTNQIQNLKHAQFVRFCPEFIPKEDVDYYFRASDAIAMPYKHIDFSGIMQEAFAYRRPVLATRVGNFGDWISQGETGYLAEEINAESFAQIIKLAFSDMNKLKAMGQAAYERDKAYPDWQAIGAMTSEVYQSL